MRARVLFPSPHGSTDLFYTVKLKICRFSLYGHRPPLWGSIRDAHSVPLLTVRSTVSTPPWGLGVSHKKKFRSFYSQYAKDQEYYLC
ncbi:MAG: hypothetical protein [Circoviridae sp.]|nr:MAG: hypothetical protein [Circoviridae sp.]